MTASRVPSDSEAAGGRLALTRREVLRTAGTALAGVGAAGMVLSRGGRAVARLRRGSRNVIVFGARQPVEIVDPHIHYDWSTRTIQQALYDALVKYVGDPPEIVPWLARSWERSADGLTWTFQLDSRARFHNGDPVTADAVVYSFQRALALKQGPSWMLDGVVGPEGVQAAGRATVRFRLRFPYSAFLAVLPWFYVVNPDVVQPRAEGDDWGSGWLRTPPHEAGSGPFRIAEWRFGEYYELEALDDYWKGWPQKPHVEGLQFRLIREASSQRLALEQGDIDIAEGVTPRDFIQLAKRPDVYVSEHRGWTTFGIKMNTKQGMTASKDFRKAICYAFDYQAILAIYEGHAVLMDSAFPVGFRGHQAVPGIYRRDMAKAREYLRRAGVSGRGTKMDYVYVAGLEEERQIGLVLSANLAELGIEINLVPKPWPEMVNLGSKVETSPNLMAVFVTPVFNDPDAVAYQYHPRSWGTYYGSHFYDNPETARLIEEGRRTVEWSRREGIYRRVQEMLVEDAPEVFGHLYNRRWALRREVGGFAYSPVRFTSEIDLYPLYLKG